MKILIVDDEPLAREGLRLLAGREPGEHAVVEAKNGREAVAMIRGDRPDLVLLDVQMPQVDGFAVVETIGAEAMPAVVFVTAYDQYAIRAFEINAVDYLLKPVAEDRFRVAFARARNRIELAGEHPGTQMLALLEAVANPRRPLQRIAVRSGERTSFVAVDGIDWFEAEGNYVRLHTGQGTHLVQVTLNTLEEALDPAAFVRIHRSIIVSQKRIKHLWASTHGRFIVELHSGQRLHSGRTYGERIRAALGNPF